MLRCVWLLMIGSGSGLGSGGSWICLFMMWIWSVCFLDV